MEAAWVQIPKHPLRSAYCTSFKSSLHSWYAIPGWSGALTAVGGHKSVPPARAPLQGTYVSKRCVWQQGQP